MNILKWSLTFILFAFFASGVQAAVRCDSVFGTASKWGQPITLAAYAGELSVAQLKQNGFRIESDGSLYVLKSSNGKSLKLGTVKTLSVDYLFEWASKDESEAWIKAGGIDYMDAILKEPGQTSGKGYYISVDPFDSNMYGTTVTAFRQVGKVIVLEYANDSDKVVSDLMENDTKLVSRLSQTGIGALQLTTGYLKSWFSIISNKPLQYASALPAGVLSDYLRDVVQSPQSSDDAKLRTLNSMGKISKETLKGLPKNDPYRRFYLLENMSTKEISDLIHPFPSYIMIDMEPMLYAHSKRLLSEAKDTKAIADILELNVFNSGMLDEIRKPLSEKDQQRLAGFGELTKSSDAMNRFVVNSSSPLVIYLHVEILKGWILEAKTEAETATRVKRATEALLSLYKLKTTP